MNQDQERAAFSDSRRVAVVAGPGSGKTTTLVEAVARRCRESGPQSVLCVTFTVAGAKEMKERLAALPPEKGGPITGLGYCGTLHGLMLRMVKAAFKWVAGVADDAVVEQVLADARERMSCRAPASMLRDMLSDRRYLLAALLGERLAKPAKEELVCVEVHRALAADGLVTLDGLLALGLEAVRKAEVWPYRHLFWDEFQDSGDTDYLIMYAMPCETKFVVGDPDQSIYGFRGARPGNFISIVSSPNWERHVLEVNYRSLPAICVAAQSLIQHNAARVQKATMPPDGVGGVATIGVSRCAIPATECATVVNILNDIIHQKCEDAGPDTEVEYRDAIKELAVLCRTNRHAEEVRNAVKAAGLPVSEQVAVAVPKDWPLAKTLVTALAAPNSRLAWFAAARALDGEEVARKAVTNAALRMTTVREELAKAGGIKWRSPSLLSMQGMLSFESSSRLGALVAQVSGPDGQLDLRDLLLAMSGPGDVPQGGAAGIHVGTVHSAKGREWDLVVLCGMEEGRFPQAKKDTDLEEERRLCFVGMTRARTTLHLTWCAARPQPRGPNLPPGPLEPKQPSRFIKEAGL